MCCEFFAKGIGLAFAFGLVALSANADDTAKQFEKFRAVARSSLKQSEEVEPLRLAGTAWGIAMSTVRQFPKKDLLDDYLAERGAEARQWDSKVAAGNALTCPP